MARLPERSGEAEVIERARSRGVGLYGMSANRSTRAVDPPQLVLGFGNLSPNAIREGVLRIGDLLDAAM